MKKNYKIIIFIFLLFVLCYNFNNIENMTDNTNDIFNNFFINQSISDEIKTEIKSLFLSANKFNEDDTIIINSNIKSTINDLLNYNNINIELIYNVEDNIKLSQIKQLFYLDQVKNELNNLELSKKNIVRLFEIILEILLENNINLCNEEMLLNYCKNNDINNNNFKLESIEVEINNFNSSSFNNQYTDILIELFTKFENKYLKSINNKSKEDILYLNKLLRLDILNLINSKRNVSEDELLIQKKKLFYLLKYQYKIISIYNYLKTETNSEKRLRSLKCCQKNSENKCYNFSTNKKENLVIYGNSSYGFFSKNNCTFDDEDKNRKYSQNLNKYLNMYNFWNIITKDKTIFYQKLTQLFQYFNIDIDNLNQPIKNVLINRNNITNLKNIFVSNIKKFNLNLDLLLSNFELKISNISNSLNIITNINEIFSILENNGFSSDDFDFNSLNDFNIVRLSLLTILKIKYLLEIFYTNKVKLSTTIKEILNTIDIPDKTLTYEKILNKYGLFPKYHQFIFNELNKILSPIEYINLGEISSNKKPSETIKYTKHIFPLKKSFDLCNNWNKPLLKMRSDKLISNDDYNKYKAEIRKFCETKETKFKLVNPLLRIDSNNNIIKINEQEIISKEANYETILVDETNKIIFINNEGDINVSQYSITDNKILENNDVLKNRTIILNNNLNQQINILLDPLGNITQKIYILDENKEDEIKGYNKGFEIWEQLFGIK